MAEQNRLVRVEPDSPLRCQGVTNLGQCQMMALTGQKHCPMHVGFGNASEKNEKLRNYRLTVYQARLDDFADNSVFSSLREETAILRMMLEQILNSCGDNVNDFMTRSTLISDLVIKIEKLVVSCKKMEEKSGLLLDKSAALKLSNTLIDIVARHVKDPNIIELIVSDYLTEMANAQNSD